MKKLNIVLVYNKEEDKILMCKREKEPYKGKLNLVGGKVEQGENELHAAYRELQEETGITKDDIKLTNLMNFEYKVQDMELELYVGKLNKEKKLVEEVNKLYWIDKKDNFFDVEKYAGEGNIGHMDVLPTEEHEIINEIVKTAYYEIKPITPEDAILKLQEKPTHNFFVFINVETGKVNVIHKLKDGKNYGLIEPEA